jgi:hypothetical protein
LPVSVIEIQSVSNNKHIFNLKTTVSGLNGYGPPGWFVEEDTGSDFTGATFGKKTGSRLECQAGVQNVVDK